MSEHTSDPTEPTPETMLHDAREPESIHVLMGRVLAELPAIEKGEEAPAKIGGYKFRGIEQITAAIKPLFAKHGVFVVPTTLDHVDSHRATSGGGTLWLIDVKVQFTFYGPGGDWVEAIVWGQGSDSGDKATQKAYTAAYKSALGLVFTIADASFDAEAHDVPDTVTTIDEQTLELLRERMNALPAEERAELRQHWVDTPSLKPYKLDRLPIEHVSLVESLVAAHEARARAAAAQETSPDAPGSDELPLDAAAQPDTASDPQEGAQGDDIGAEAERLVSTDPPDDWVRAIIEETSNMDGGAVDAELREWTLPKGGNLTTRRRRLAVAKVRDALRPPR